MWAIRARGGLTLLINSPLRLSCYGPNMLRESMLCRRTIKASDAVVAHYAMDGLHMIG
jgi:hypothetical protein